MASTESWTPYFSMHSYEELVPEEADPTFEHNDRMSEPEQTDQQLGAPVP
jgi:hypothetical protein